MLEETAKFLEDVNRNKKNISVKTNKRKNILKNIKKYTIKVLLTGLCVCILFFPKETGTIIGTWVNDFFITIYKNIIK